MNTQVKQTRHKEKKGKLIISLDVELFWGVHDVFTKESYGDNIYGAHDAVPAMLELFEEYEIHATWAIVGLLMMNNMQDVHEHTPKEVPAYANKLLSPFEHIRREHIEEKAYDLYFAPDLIRTIAASSGQEIASHTFSHYYCLEKGQSLATFMADAELFQKIIQPLHTHVQSIVFPRNQINKHYLAACRDLGFTTYRGNEKGWMYEIKQHDRIHLLKRASRLLDTFINLSGHQTYALPQATDHVPLNLPGSRQLKPVLAFPKWLARRRLKRICNAMTHAAKQGEIYHLWWHPHNFGVRLEENLHFLKQILTHYQQLHVSYGFQCVTMGEQASQVMKNDGKPINQSEGVAK